MSFSPKRFWIRCSIQDFTRHAQVVQAPARQAKGESIPCFSHCSVIDALESPVKECQFPEESLSFIVIIWFLSYKFLAFGNIFV